jgi:MFS family permease
VSTQYSTSLSQPKRVTTDDVFARLGQPSFLAYMHLIDLETGEVTPNGNRLIGSFSGVFQAGAFFGVIIASWVMDRFGRKAGVAYCSFFSLFGGAWLTGSTNAAMVSASGGKQ